MTDEKGKTGKTGTSGEGCDIRVWCQSCQRSDYKTEGEKYLCASCGKVMGLNHEVRHEGFPHISGDDDNLS